MRKNESAVAGQTIRTETGPRREKSLVNERQALDGRDMKGGPTDMKAALEGPAMYANKGRGRKSD